MGSSQSGVTECHVHSQHSSWKIRHLRLYGIPLVQCETNSFGSPGWDGQDTGKCYQHTTTPHSCLYRARDHRDPTHGLWVLPPKGERYTNHLCLTHRNQRANSNGGHGPAAPWGAAGGLLPYEGCGAPLWIWLDVSGATSPAQGGPNTSRVPGPIGQRDGESPAGESVHRVRNESGGRLKKRSTSGSAELRLQE